MYLENYAWDLGALLTAGVDVWVNTPRRPYEASGTSGMKAALNGVPSLSILDGWWIEGCIEGVTGWAIEDGANDAEEAQSLYHKLETAVVPLYRDAPEKWARLMRTTLAFNGSYFNTNRMVKQYTRNAYYPVKLIEHGEGGRSGVRGLGGGARMFARRAPRPAALLLFWLSQTESCCDQGERLFGERRKDSRRPILPL